MSGAAECVSKVSEWSRVGEPYSSIAQSVSALDFNFERAVGGSILTAGKKLSLENLNVTIRAIN